MYENLKFRRQFLLTRAPVKQLSDWKQLQIDQYCLYAHPDLEVNQLADTKKRLVLIGSIFDSEEPKKGNVDILDDILANADTFDKIVLWIKRYAGRYALLYKDDKNAFIQHDALGLREIYYCTKHNRVVCGSQPNTIAEFADPEIKPTSDPDVLDFYENHLKNSSWIGDETYYTDIKHLLPNHCLDINRSEVHRYWPSEPIKRLDLDVAVSMSCRFLQGIMRAIVHRHSVMMAVTAGTDSRTLLAASKGLDDQIYYFVNNQGLGYKHPDISIPVQIFASTGVPFHVHDVQNTVDDSFKRIFLGNTFFATERILATIYNVYFKNHSEKVNILGIGEIGRTRYGKQLTNLTGFRMAYKMGYGNCRYAIKQCEQMRAEMEAVAKKFGVNALTLLYWEQQMGNWGTVGNSESDIAIEEIDPYASHYLYEVFLGVDDKFTKYKQQPCVFFREMIRNMWPELLEWPINPPYSILDKIKSFLWKVGMFDLLKELKFLVSYIFYLCKARK